MADIKHAPDTKRFARYQSVLNILLAKNSFSKRDIYAGLKDEKPPLIGRVINELGREGYLTSSGPKGNLQYSWSPKKEKFNEGRWIDQKVFTPTIKRSPSTERPRERLLQLGPSELKTSELFAILIRSGLQGESATQAGEKLATYFGNDLQKRVESMFKLADAVEKQVAAASARAEKLAQAILAKAFRGELVPTEAELARCEGRSYETASELLSRIKSDQDSKQASQRVRRNRN